MFTFLKFIFLFYVWIIKLLLLPFRLLFKHMRERKEYLDVPDDSSQYWSNTNSPYANDVVIKYNSSDFSPDISKIKGFTFGKWDASDHLNRDQISRQLRALDNQYIPIFLDRLEEKARFKGNSSPEYETTLNNCTCVDFSKRWLPCKHMYRLAIELGYFPALDKYTAYSEGGAKDE